MTGGDASRIAVFPSSWILAVLVVGAIAASWLVKLRLEHAWPLAISLFVWLPFVPGHVPNAFLIWQGPLEAIVWTIVIVGLIFALTAAIPRAVVDPAIAPWIAAALLASSSLYAFEHVRDVVPGGDEPHYLVATQSVLHDGDLKVANNYAKGEYLDYFGGHLEPHFLTRSTTGEIYSIHAPGVSMLVLPAFAIAGYTGAVMTMILIAALTAALTWRIAHRLSASAAAAWIGVLSVCATTPYFFETFTIYPEVTGSLLVMVGAWLLFELNDGREMTLRKLIAVGAAMATLPWLHSRFAVIAAIFGVIIIARLWRRRDATQRIAAFMSVPVIAGIGWFTFFYVIWGSPSPAAPYGADTSTSAAYDLRGLIGLLFDQQFGLITTAPVFVMTAAGGFALFKRHRRLTIELFVIVAAYAISVASYAMWWAGNAAPARFLVAILPLAALPIAMVGTDAVTIVLTVISIALAVPRAVVEGGRFIFNNRGGMDATIEWITRNVDLSLALPSVHRDGGSTALRDAVIWIAFFVATTVAARMLARRGSMSARYAANAIGMGITAIGAATTVWSLHAQSVVTPDRSKLAAIAEYRPDWHTAPQDFLAQLSIAVEGPARLNRVPAGVYDVVPATATGPWRVSVGRNDRPIAEFGDQPARLAIGVGLQTMNVSTVSFTLRPKQVFPAYVSGYAIRAARYGETRAYFLDARAFPERDGFWTRADAATSVVITSDGPETESDWPLTVTAGAVPTSVTLSTHDWEERLVLAAGEQRTVALPGANGIWPLRIVSGAGFRPSEREPGSTDVRMLAAWIAFPH